MPIYFFAENLVVNGLKKRIVANWLKNAIELETKTLGTINFIFCSDDDLLVLNKKYLNHDYYTDILSFDYSQNNIVSGDLYISYDRIKDNAKSLNVSTLNELHRVCIHGVLHLCGYLDKAPDDKQLMTFKENFYLNIL
jgi:rRNA maturation RNase YbeY